MFKPHHSSILLFLFFLSIQVLAFPTQTLQIRASGCGTAHPIAGIGLTTYHSLTSGNKTRKYSVHLPSGYDPNHKYPTVLGFHGSSSVGFFFEVDSRLSEAKYSGNKIMVYPNGIDGSWAGPSYAKTTVQEDLTFVSDLVNNLRSNYCIDNSRIYATGLSNGGGFVDTIACSTVGGEFAAFAPASGSFYTDTNGPHNGCAPGRNPLPILEFHGGEDKSVNYNGGKGEGGLEPSIPDWLGYWATRNSCTNETQVDSFGDKVHHLSWTCSGVNGFFQHYKIDDMGHQWASTEINFSAIAAGHGPTYIDASMLIMQFFDQFSKSS